MNVQKYQSSVRAAQFVEPPKVGDQTPSDAKTRYGYAEGAKSGAKPQSAAAANVAAYGAGSKVKGTAPESLAGRVKDAVQGAATAAAASAASSAAAVLETAAKPAPPAVIYAKPAPSEISQVAEAARKTDAAAHTPPNATIPAGGFVSPALAAELRAETPPSGVVFPPEEAPCKGCDFVRENFMLIAAAVVALLALS